MKEMLKILKNYKFVKKEFYLTLFFGILMESLYVIFPQFTKKIISIIENRWSLEDLYLWLSYLAIFSFVAIFVTIIYDFFWNKLWLLSYSKKIIFYRKKIFSKNYKDIIDIGTWKLLTRVNNWVTGEIDIFTSVLNILISAVFRWMLVIIILTLYIPKFIFVVIFLIIILFVINFYIRKYIKYYNEKEQELLENDGRQWIKIIMENFIIRLFWKVDYELEKSKRILEKFPYYWTRVDTANKIFYQFLEFILRLLEIGIFFVVGTLIIKEWNLEISYLVMLTGYIWFLWWPLDKAISNMNHINKQWEKYKKLQEFIEKPNEIKNWKKEYVYKWWKIEFKNIDFSYNKWNYIFKDFNLKFLSGKKNALVGHSGWWKSTIIKLFLRFYDYEKWKILIDNQDLKELKIETFYEKIWYLPQEAGIFDGTIRENLEYAFKNWEKIDENKIWEALKKAQIKDMIEKLEKWLDTEIWEKWVKLSWWEKQRLAIARIFLKDPEIIILDEPTSALDSISESKITKALDELTKNKTSIIIAHRLQTVMHSDQIIVLEKWKVESKGIHNDLLQTSKTYKTLVDLQNGAVME